MKNSRLANPVIPDYRPKADRKQEELLPERFCIICTKKTKGYGPWAEGFTCSPDCEATKEAQPKLHGGQLCTPP